MLPDPLDLRSVRDPEIIRLGEIVRAIRDVAPDDALLLIGAQARNLERLQWLLRGLEGEPLSQEAPTPPKRKRFKRVPGKRIARMTISRHASIRLCTANPLTGAGRLSRIPRRA